MSKLCEKTRARLVEQRAEISILVEQELKLLRDRVYEWLNSVGKASAVGCPVTDLVLRRTHSEVALDMPDGIEVWISRRCLRESEQNAWVRTQGKLVGLLRPEHLRPLARLLVNARATRIATEVRV